MGEVSELIKYSSHAMKIDKHIGGQDIKLDDLLEDMESKGYDVTKVLDALNEGIEKEQA
ncbi:hypothetical protein LC087_18775 (plasmid) [Bacillus carboniphilus]|uniref:Uncharacterized protein n=1 Tax=Bacillus carboniphilus TaxID=86663 RepID=A0ABY9K144_9BACI|nr:hypothetical protein [Bacillus carboniphilus]WLR44428.1 hypothetical protein LC087_18775 [Bacillus carboniphilus]